jgi:hypothetical protein
MTNKNAALAGFAVIFLSACGGGSTGSVPFSQTPNPPQTAPASPQATFENRVTRGTALVESFEAAGPTTVMPTSGTAQYRGVAGFSDVQDFEQADVFVTSDIAMTANFTASGGTISGELSNFIAKDDESTFIPISGTLAIASADISGATFSSTVSGTLVGEGETVPVTGQVDGQFVGADAAGIGAEIELFDATANETLYGIGVLERQ